MKTKNAAILIFIFVLSVIAIYTCTIIYITWPISELSVTKSGVFGDSFGGVNALFSGLAFAGLIITALLQRDEIQLSRQAFERQQFEASFFNLLSLYSDNLREIKIKKESDSGTYEGIEALSFLIKKLRESVQKHAPAVDDDIGRQVYEYELFCTAKAIVLHQSRYLLTLQYLLSLIHESISIESEREKYISLIASQFTEIEVKYLFYKCLTLSPTHELALYVNASKTLLARFDATIVTKKDKKLYERIHSTTLYSSNNRSSLPYTRKHIRKLKLLMKQRTQIAENHSKNN